MNKYFAVIFLVGTLTVSSAFASTSVWSEIDSLLDDGDVEQAAQLVDELDPDEEGRQLFYQGRIALAQGEHKASIKQLNKAVKQWPENADYHAWLGMAYGARAISAGLFGKASAAGNSREAFMHALELDTNHQTALSGLVSFHSQAPGIVGGDKDKALEFAERLLKLDVDKGSAALAQAHSARKEYDQALEVIDTWLMQTDNKSDAYLVKLNVYGGQQDWDNCFAVLEDWQKNFAVNSRYLYLTGRVAVISGQRLEQAGIAMQNYLTKVALDERYEPHWTHYTIGQIHEQRQKNDDAKLAYRLALDFEPGFEQAQDALRKLGG